MGVDPEGGVSFAEALRAAIAARGTTLGRLRERLRDGGNPVSIATLSYWRSGDRRPEGAQSLSAVEDLERILGLESGRLTALVLPAGRVGPTRPPRLPFDEERERREVEETLTALASAPQDSLRDLSTHMLVHVGADGAIERTVTRCLVQATKGVITELPLIDVAPEETEIMSEISDVVGGRVDREYLHPGRLVSGVVLALDEPITVGRTTLLEFSETFPAGYPPRTDAWHANTRACRELLIWVRFAPEAVPAWCEEYVETEDGEEFWERQVVGASVHATRHGFGPGLLGIRWGYDS